MPGDIKKFVAKNIKEAGKIARRGFRAGHKTGWKERHNPVTPTDIKINRYLVGQIKNHYPAHSIISEELPPDLNDSEYTWFIDPIDGTIPFSQGIPYFCISLGLAKKDKMIFAAVYDPIHDELFSAQKGKGAYLNGRKIKSTAHERLTEAYIDFAVWQAAPYKLLDLQNYINKICYVSSHHACLVLSCCYVAVGRMDAAIFAGDTPWDVAAGSLICREAKVKCTNLDGSIWQADAKPIGMIAARPKLHQTLLKLTKARVSGITKNN